MYPAPCAISTAEMERKREPCQKPARGTGSFWRASRAEGYPPATMKGRTPHPRSEGRKNKARPNQRPPPPAAQNFCRAKREMSPSILSTPPHIGTDRGELPKTHSPAHNPHPSPIWQPMSAETRDRMKRRQNFPPCET